MSKQNFPQQQINTMAESNPTFVADTVNSLLELRSKGKPQNIEELQTRIDDYFKFCADSGYRPAIESLSLSLGISRVTFWQWRNGSRGDEWQEICESAAQMIITFLEQCMMCGKINPASSIFLLKNIAGYSDSQILEFKRSDTMHDVKMSIEDIASRIPIEDIKERSLEDASYNTDESN